ncbi:MAG: nuclear transport factor 2 family protein [Myxococcales bacterium]|nr:nuclear transport factor 2 family protein [Myxococcales bacterium]
MTASDQGSAQEAALRAYAERITAHDADGVLALFAEGDDVFVEDPVGAPRVQGRAAVERFYRRAAGEAAPEITVTGPIRTTMGRGAALPMRVRYTYKGRRFEADVVDIMRFDDAGKIVSMEAYWHPARARPVD